MGENCENKAVGISRGGRTTKIHAVVDGLGNPVARLKVCVNLGNTFDAGSGEGLAEDELSLEKAWCGVYTTPEIIFEYKKRRLQHHKTYSFLAQPPG